MFHRIITGTTTQGDAFLVGLVMFACFAAGIAIGLIYG